MTETWKNIDDFPGYEVSDAGRVRSVDRIVKASDGRMIPVKGRVLAPGKGLTGYLSVNLWRNNRQSQNYVHRLVATAFLGKPSANLQVNHIDCDKANNALSNLEWVTRHANMQHAVTNGLCGSGERNSASKLTTAQVIEIRKASNDGERQGKIAAHFGISQSAISAIVTGKTWAKAAA